MSMETMRGQSTEMNCASRVPSLMSDDNTYDTDMRPRLLGLVSTVLQELPCSYASYSFGDMYSAAYKCIWKNYAERLFIDLSEHVAAIVRKWMVNLLDLTSRPEEHISFVTYYHRILIQFFWGVEVLLPIFAKMDQIHVRGCLHSNLRRELVNILQTETPTQVSECLYHILKGRSTVSLVIPPVAGKFLTDRLVHVYSHQSHLDPGFWENHWPQAIDDFRKDELDEQLRGQWTLQELIKNADSKKRKELEEDGDNPFPRFKKC